MRMLTFSASGTSFFFECLKGVNLGIAYSTSPAARTAPPLLGTWYHKPVAAGSATLNPNVRTVAFLNGSATVDLRANCLKTHGGFTIRKPGTIDLLTSRRKLFARAAGLPTN